MGAVVRFPTTPAAVNGSAMGISAFVVRDKSLKGIKPGEILICRPFKKKDAKPTSIVIVKIGTELVAKRFKDVSEGEIKSQAFLVQRPL